MRFAPRAKVFLVLLAAAAFIPAQAQNINARVSGGGGNGKCTFEIRTGGTVEVQIRGGQGSLRAISGGPAQWVRLDCNQLLPRNPNNFRFQGVDGRGSQNLVRDPNSNNGTAVIRIVDNRGGMHGYTGDILWNGGSNGNGNGGGGQWPGNGNGNNNGQWPGGNNNWSKNIVPNCQNAIRKQLIPQYGGSLNFQGTPSQNQGGSFVMVQGRAYYRDRSGQTGNIQYNCTMHPNGNVADAKYNVLNGNFQPQPR